MLSHIGYQSSKRRAALAKTITIRKIPDALYDRLVAAAKTHRRSLEDEAMACLEAGLEGRP
jgi:plasmid stability protein